MRDAFSSALVAAARRDPKVVLLTGDHGYALFDAFRRECPDQFINCGIAEQNMVGVAAGLAKGGFKPIVYGLAAFVPVRVLEQIKIDVCYEGLPVMLIGDGAGVVYSHLGASHQSTEDIGCTRVISGLTVLSPADRHEMMAVMNLGLDLAGPVYIRVGKSDQGDVHVAPVSIAPGQILRVRRGGGLAILATGSMVSTALALRDSGLNAEVWSVPCIKPMDASQLEDIAGRVSAIITMEEHSVMGGLGSVVTEALAQRARVPVMRIGVEDRFSAKAGTWKYLMGEHGLDVESVRTRIDEFLADPGQRGFR